MQSLAQFKEENGVTKIDLLQGKGRMFATVNGKDVIVSNNCNMGEPLFITKNDEKGFYTIHNAGAKVVASV